MSCDTPPRDGVPTAEETRRALERVLASKVFRTAESLSRILQFIVEHTIEGRADRLKEYTIGAEVLERGASFDPQTDPIVRVQAGRLRAKLLQYYQTEGARETIRIDLPRGGYVPEMTSTAAIAPNPTAVHVPAARARAARYRRWTVLGIAAVLAAQVWVLTRRSQDTQNDSAVIRATVDPPPGSVPLFFALSPDARWLAIAASDGERTHLWLRGMNSPDARMVVGSDGETNSPPFWSPDSRSVGFFANGELKKLDVSTGQVQRLCTAPVSTGGAWNKDGVILFSPGIQDRLFRIESGGGTPTPVTSLDFGNGEESHRFPSFLPDGRRFVFYVRATRPDVSGIYLGSLDGGRPKRILSSESAASVASQHHLLFSRNGTLLDAEFDAKNGRILGDPRPITGGLSTNQRLRWGRFSVSEGRTLVFDSSPVAETEREMYWVDRQGRPVRLAGKIVNSRHLSLSFSGMRVAYDYPDPATATAAISVLDLRRGAHALVVAPPERADDPVLSRDGKRIAFRSIADGKYQLRCRDLDTASADSIELLRSPQPLYPTDWSPDGAYLLFDRLSAEKSDSWLLTLAKPNEPVLFQAGASLAQFSPDGRFVVYAAGANGRKEVFVTSFPPKGTRSQISASGGSKPRWSGDGRRIFYLAPDLRLMEVPVWIEAWEIRSGPPAPLFQTSFDYHDERMPYAPNLDGTAFLVAPYPRQQPVLISVITNWPALSSRNK